MRCNGCGSEIVRGAAYCFKCGMNFGTGSTQSLPGGQSAAPASFLGGQRIQAGTPMPGQPASYPGTQVNGIRMQPQQPPQGRPPQAYPGAAQSAAYTQSYSGAAQSAAAYTQSYPGRQSVFLQTPVQSGSNNTAAVQPGAYQNGTTAAYVPGGTASRRARIRGHQLTAEEKLIRAKHEAKIRERYENPSVAWLTIIFGILAMTLVLLFFVVNFAHYIGIGFGALACFSAIFARLRNNKFAFFGFFAGIIAILGAVTIIILTLALGININI